MKKICFWWIFMAMFLGVSAQDCSLILQLTLLDDHSREPLESATIQLKATEKTWFTTSDGRVNLTGLCPGKIVLEISHVGCEPKTVEITILNSTAREIVLHHVKVELGEVSVTGVRQGEAQVQETLRGSKLFATRGLNLAQSLEAVNGVRTLNTGATIGKPVIHGLHSNRIVMVTNGVKLESQQWGTDHAPEIDPYNSDKFLVVKGAASVRYGAEAIAGVIIAEPRPLPHDKELNGEINLAGFTNNGLGVISGLVEGANGKSTNIGWRLQGTLKKGGTVRIPGYWLANTAMDEGNFSAALSIQKNQWNWDAGISYFSTQLGLYPGAHVENVDDLKDAIASDKPLYPGDFTYKIARPFQQAKHWMAKAGGKVVWNPKHTTSFWVAHQLNKREEFDSRTFNPYPDLSLELATTSAELMHTFDMGNGMVWQNGGNFSFQQNVNNPASARVFVRNFETWNLGGFSIFKMKSGGFTNEIGIRYDYKDFTSYYRNDGVLYIDDRTFNNVTATLGTHYEVLPGLGVTMNMANAWRPPSPNELYANGLHQGLAAVEVGNPNFKAEKATNINFQVNYRQDSIFSFEISLYNNRIKDFIYLQPVQPPALTINGYYPKFEYRQTDANLSGVDFLTSFNPWQKMEVYTKINLLYAKNLKTEDWLIWMPADRLEAGFSWFPTMNKKYTKPYLKTSVTYTKQQERIPGNGNDPELNDYAPPPPAYGLINIEAGTIFTKSKIQAGFSIYNLANTQFRDYMNRFRYFADEAGINVALRLKIPLTF